MGQEMRAGTWLDWSKGHQAQHCASQLMFAKWRLPYASLRGLYRSIGPWSNWLNGANTFWNSNHNYSWLGMDWARIGKPPSKIFGATTGLFVGTIRYFPTRSSTTGLASHISSMAMKVGDNWSDPTWSSLGSVRLDMGVSKQSMTIRTLFVWTCHFRFFTIDQLKGNGVHQDVVFVVTIGDQCLVSCGDLCFPSTAGILSLRDGSSVEFHLTCTTTIGPLMIYLQNLACKPSMPLKMGSVSLGVINPCIVLWNFKICNRKEQSCPVPCESHMPFTNPASATSEDLGGSKLRLVCIGTKGDWPFLRKDPWMITSN